MTSAIIRQNFLYCIGQTEAGIATLSIRAQAYYAAEFVRFLARVR